jgi:general secretion pathway protein G
METVRASGKGFTLIELLIVVAIIGIIAAIAIPNLLNAIDRGKQKRTMADLRTVGTAVETYEIDNSLYPLVSAETDIGSSSWPTVLGPTFIRVLPATDG